MQTYGHVQTEKKKESHTNFLSSHILIVSNLDKTLYTPSDFRRWHFAQLGPNRSVRIIFQCLRQAGSIGGIQNLLFSQQVQNVSHQIPVERGVLLLAFVEDFIGHGRQFDNVHPQRPILVPPLLAHMGRMKAHDILQNGISGKLRVAGCVFFIYGKAQPDATRNPQHQTFSRFS